MKKSILLGIQVFSILFFSNFFFNRLSGVRLGHPYWILSNVVMFGAVVVWVLVDAGIIKLEKYTTPRAVANFTIISLLVVSSIFSFIVPSLSIKIKSTNDMNRFKWHANGTFIIVNDLDFTGYEYDEDLDCIIEEFSGLLDGGDHTISYQEKPLICTSFGNIKNLTINNVNIDLTGVEYAGILINESRKGYIKNVEVSGIIESDGVVGGLVGSSNATIEKVTITNSLIRGNNYTGGVIGEMMNGSINIVQFQGHVYSNTVAGGLVGKMYDGVISNTIILGSVNGLLVASGIAGYTHVEVEIGTSVVHSDIEGESGAIVAFYDEKHAETVITPILFSGDIVCVEYNEEEYTYVMLGSILEDGVLVNDLNPGENTLEFHEDILLLDDSIWDIGFKQIWPFPTLIDFE
ncbi:hypothetical protein OAO42_00495 [Candidatus Izimaplasma bacterium]|nr:hypothetical protein [Candidatus Izimaplasma bacterium]